MAGIKASEVSEVLKMQLEGIDTHVQFEEIGTVLQVSDGAARIYGLTNVEAGELVTFENGAKAVAMNLEEDNVGVVILGHSDDIHEGEIVKRTKLIASIESGDGLLGRIVNSLGEPIDGKAHV